MVTRSKFYYPADFHRDADVTSTLIPWVNSLPLAQFVVDPAVVLESDTGDLQQGMYVYDGSQWRFAMPTEAISASIINGAALSLYYNLTLPVALPVRAQVYKNGQLQPDDNIVPGNAIYAVTLPPASGGAGAVNSVNTKIGDVVLVATDIGGFAAVALSGLYTDLIGIPPGYALPAATATTLGGVIIPAASNLQIDSFGNLDIDSSLMTTINAKFNNVVTVGDGVSTVESVVAGVATMRAIKAGTNVTVASDGNGNIVVSSTASGSTTLTGDVTGSGTNSINTVLALSGVTAGVYTQVTVDAKGRAISGANPTTLAGYGIVDALSIHGGSVDGDVTFTSGAGITGLLNPVNPPDAANKAYVDSVAASLANGVSWRQSVQVASTANVVLTGLQTIDGYAVQVSDRVLIKDQTNQTENGVYVAAVGAWTRATDTDTGPELLNMATLALKGTANGLTQWTNTNTGSITLGTTNVTFSQLQGASPAYVAGAGLALTGVTFSIATTGVVAGTYSKVTVNTRGQVTAGAQLTPTDISNILGYVPYNGTTNPSGFLTSAPTVTYQGDVTGSGTSPVTLTLATSGVTPGTYTKVTVDAKGRVTLGAQISNAEISAAIGYTPYNGTTNPNGYIGTSTPIVLSGDITGTGIPNITTVLSNTGVVAGTYSKVTVDAKGRVTVGAQLTNAEISAAIGYTPYNGTTNPNGYISANQTITATGDVTGSGSTSLPLTLAASGVTAGTYSKVTVDAKGRVTVGAQLSNAEISAAIGYTPVNKAGDTLSGTLNNAPTVIVNSAASTPVGSATSNSITILGTTTINGFDTAPNGSVRTVRFAGILTLTYNASNFVLPTAANIVTAAGDTAQFTSNGTGWICNYYQRFNGLPLAGGNSSPFTTTQEFDGSTTQVAAKFKNIVEIDKIIGVAPVALQDFSTSEGSVQYFTTAATINFNINFRHDAATSLNTALAVGESITVAAVTTQGASAFLLSGIRIDGTAVTPKWQGGSAPGSGNANSLDVYSFTIIKTAAATFTVLASQTQFK